MYTKAKWEPVEVPEWVLAIPGGLQAFIRGQGSVLGLPVKAPRRARRPRATPAH